MIELPRLLIDPACPVDWSHPLNVGHVGWWLRIPNSGWSGGITCRDLVQGGRNPNHGTLTNSPTWIGSQGRPGGYGALSYSGGTDYTSIPSTLIGSLPAGKVSAFAWIRPTGSLTGYQTIFDGTSNGSGSGRQLSVFLGGAANHIFVSLASADVTGEITLTDSWVLNTWQHFGLTWTGTLVTIYRNGVSVGSLAVGTNRAFSACEWRLAANPSGGGAAYQGQQDDVAVYNRTLSASQVSDLSEQSRRGHPDTLNWLGRKAWFTPIQAGGGGSTFNQSISVSVSDTLTFSRSIGKITSLSNTSTSTLTRAISKGINLSISDTIARQLQISKTGSVSNSNSSTVTKNPGKILSNNNTSALTLANQVGKILTDSISSTNTVIKGVSKSIVTSITVVNALEAIKAFISTLTLSVSSTATSARQTGKVLSDTVSGTSTAVRNVSKSMVVSVSSTATQVAIRAFLATLDVIASVTNSLSRSINKVASNNSSTTTTITRSISKLLSVTGTTSLIIVRIINKTVAKAVSVTDTLTTTNTYGSVLSSSVSSASTLSRSIARIVSLTVSRTCSITKNINRRISLNISQLSVVGRGHSVSLSITSTIIGVLNAVKTVLATTYRKVFLLGKNSTNITLHGKDDTSVSNYGE